MPFKHDFQAPAISNGFMAAPALTVTINREEFHQTPIERGAAYTEKAKLRKQLRAAYGANWKKHLNVPEKTLGTPMKMQF